jgi:hypothetical protein
MHSGDSHQQHRPAASVSHLIFFQPGFPRYPMIGTIVSFIAFPVNWCTNGLLPLNRQFLLIANRINKCGFNP